MLLPSPKWYDQLNAITWNVRGFPTIAWTDSQFYETVLPIGGNSLAF
jgi:hypothetical protein